MEIKKINPQGFCKGVINAIKILNEAINNDNYKKPLYMLGGIVHNKHIINAYANKGVKIIQFDDLKNIDSGTIIITAHGLSESKKDYIKSKNLDIIDTTCSEVKKIHSIIANKLAQNYTVVYFGVKTHPECLAIIEDNPNIVLLEKGFDINNVNIKNNKILFASQTTVSYNDVRDAFNALQNKYPYIETMTSICNATKERQMAIIKQAKDADLIMIVGDKMSNNTKMLASISESITKTVLIENLEDLKNIDFKNINKLYISAGASTPNVLVSEIIKTIKNKNHHSILTDDDYINYKKKTLD